VNKLVYIFLNTKYPDAHVKRCIFGELCYLDGNNYVTNNLLKEISSWFNVDENEANRYVKVWCSSLPVVVSLRNSTNPAVLVSETTVVNSTL
jgi:hypothetical protein